MPKETHTDLDSRLYVGGVSHRRIRPLSHRFSYKVFSLLINLDELPKLDAMSRLFAINKFAPMSFYDEDHGPKDGSPLKPWIAQKLNEADLYFSLGKVQLLCFPRLFGFTFNPISVWYCYDTEDNLRAVLYEVRNTFGEWRGYLLPVAKDHKSRTVKQYCEKAFYVSPLMDMNCQYHFTLHIPDEKLLVAIRETQENQRTLLAAQTGTALPFSSASLKKVLATHPLMFVKVVWGIHYHAIRMILKGGKFFTNPSGKTGDIVSPSKHPAE